MFSENLIVLKQRFPLLYEQIKDGQCNDSTDKIEIIDAKNGIPTLYYKADGAQIFIHSKYNPVDEASKLLEKYSDISKYKHVFFYGIGLGYHIEAFMDKYPNISVSLYEPDMEIFNKVISARSINRLLKGKVASIYAGEEYREVNSAVSHFVNMINGEVLFIALPSYERIFGDKYKAFLEAFHMALKNKIESLHVQTHFQKLWTMNSIKNFKKVMNSSNILLDKKQYFAGKPVIIVAAGPSLEDELENLRLIKENGLAYIFSVGSAINTLISNNILPHAVCIYDPAINTNEVIRKVKEQCLDIPLVFGSSVYAGALEDYPADMLHIISSQDTISQYFLKAKAEKELEKIIDAPSIAIVALQMLVMLGCTPIILVGQNFAFKNNKYYAKGIEYNARPEALSNYDLDNAIETEDVQGRKVQSSPILNHMRNQMEMYIRYNGCKDIVNATKGGANIKGTAYKPLEELLKEELTTCVVDMNWIKTSGQTYDIGYLVSRGKLMSEEREAAEGLISELISIMIILRIESSTKKLQNSLSKFEKAYNKLIANDFFNYVLRPMNRVQFDIISKNITELSVITDTSESGRFIVKTFSDVLDACAKDINSLKYDFCDMLKEIVKNDI